MMLGLLISGECDVRDYTFYSNRHQTSRTDLFLISHDIVKNVTQSKIHPIVTSDHSPIQIDLELKSAPVCFKQWKVNDSLFRDPEIKKQISEYIHTFIDINKNSINDLPMIWEALKCCLRGELIKISSFKKKIQQQEENKLLPRIKLLQSSLSNEYKNEIWMELCKLKMKYDDIIGKKN